MDKAEIPACTGRRFDLKKNQRISVIDAEGGQVADFFAVKAGDPDEFLSTAVTIDCNESLRLQVGSIIYTNLYHPMFEVLYDDVGVHDLLFPSCRKEMYDFFYQNGEGHPNCYDNINHALGERRPIINPLNLFMNTSVGPDERVTINPPVSKPGDKIVLKALMDVHVGIAACSVSESETNSGRCTGIAVEIGGFE